MRAPARRPLDEMRQRAARTRWRWVRPPDQPTGARPLRLWLPLTPILVLLAPLVLLVLAVAVFLPRPFGVHPAQLVLGLGRTLMAMSGAQIEVEGPRTSLLIRIF
mgnify:CR=1 FL=1